MVDPHITLRRDSGFGVQGHTGASGPEHAQIIGPVTHGQHISRRNAQPGGNLLQRLNFCRTPQNRANHLSGQFAILHQQRIGPVFVKPQSRRNTGGKSGEAARHKCRITALRLHRRHQFKAAWHISNPVAQHVVEDG